MFREVAERKVPLGYVRLCWNEQTNRASVWLLDHHQEPIEHLVPDPSVVNDVYQHPALYFPVLDPRPKETCLP